MHQGIAFRVALVAAGDRGDAEEAAQEPSSRPTGRWAGSARDRRSALAPADRRERGAQPAPGCGTASRAGAPRGGGGLGGRGSVPRDDRPHAGAPRRAPRRARGARRARPRGARPPLPPRARRGRDGGRARHPSRHGQVADVARPRAAAGRRRGGGRVNGLERELAALSDAVEWPDSPDLALRSPAASTRLRGGAARCGGRSRSPWPWCSPRCSPFSRCHRPAPRSSTGSGSAERASSASTTLPPLPLAPGSRSARPAGDARGGPGAGRLPLRRPAARRAAAGRGAPGSRAPRELPLARRGRRAPDRHPVPRPRRRPGASEEARGRRDADRPLRDRRGHGGLARRRPTRRSSSSRRTV